MEEGLYVQQTIVDFARERITVHSWATANPRDIELREYAIHSPEAQVFLDAAALTGLKVPAGMASGRSGTTAAGKLAGPDTS